MGRTKSWGALISSSSPRWLPPRKQLMSPSAWAPVQVPPGPHLPSLPARRPVLRPSVLAPEGPEVTRAQLDWLLTTHQVASLCGARGVVALGSAESMGWDPFNEGESLGFSVLCAWGLGASQQQPPRSRKRPREPLRGAVSPARPQTRWVGWGAQSSLPGQQCHPQDTSTQPTKTEGWLGSVIPVHASPPPPAPKPGTDWGQGGRAGHSQVSATL